MGGVPADAACQEPGRRTRRPGARARGLTRLMTVTRTACSYCGVGCGIEVTTTADAGRARHRQGVGRQAAPGQLRPAVHQGRDPRRDDGRRRRAAEIGAAAAIARRRTGAHTGRRRRRRGRHGDCGPSSTSTVPTPSRSTCRARCPSRRSIWPTNWPRASCAPCTSSRTRGCAWPAQAPDSSSRSAPTDRPAPTPTSTAPTCFSSSAPTWPTAIRSCS